MPTPRYAYLLVLLIGGLLSACQSGDLDVGQAVIDPLELQVQSLDSVTIQTSTVLVPDSFVTSSDTSLLVGRWNDAQTGQLLAKGFAGVDYAANSLAEQRTLRLDSLVLELGYAFSYGDTISSFALNVHRLRSALTTGQTYYNSSSAEYETAPLLQKTFVPRPASGSRLIRLRLPDNLAQAFFNQLVSGAINDQATLDEFWTGFAFVSQPTANTFLGLSANTASGLRLYYHDTDISRTATTVRFPLTSAHFSQLGADRSGTALNALQRQTDYVSSTSTGRSTFVALGAALRTRIDLPYLDQFARPEQFAGLNNAFLVIEPIRHDLRDNMPPPTSLALYTLNSQNGILATVPAAIGGTTAAVASYAYDPNALELTDAYAFDLTQYISQVIRRQIPNRSLLLTVPLGTTDLRSVVQRVTLGDQNRSSDRIRLRLFISSGTQ